MPKLTKISNVRFVLNFFFIAITMSLVIAGCGNNAMNKAEEFMEAGMFVQAVALLEKKIMDSPTNAKAHLLLGMCNLSLGKLREAENSFKSAIQLKPELGNKIGNDLLKFATKASFEDKSKIFQTVSMAINYEPSLKKDAALYYVDRATKAQSTKETIDLLQVATSFDNNIKPSAGEILIEKARYSAEVGKLTDSYLAILAATSMEPKNRKIGVTILTDALTTMGKKIPIESAKNLVSNILSLDSNVMHSLGGILLDFTENDLDSGNVSRSVQWIEYMLKKQFVHSDDKARIRLLLVDAANKSIANKENYIDVVKMLVSHFPDITQSTAPKERYLFGAYLWMSGNKTRALEFLRQIPDNNGTLGLNFVNTYIPPGRYPVELNKEGDFGIGTFIFTLEAIEVSQDASTTVLIRVKNPSDRKQYFIFFGVQGEEKRRRYANASRVRRAVRGGDDERFYIIDDFGNKYFSNPPHFLKSPNRKEFNGTNDVVALEPKQEITEQLHFGPMSNGITSISFISPKHNGHQWEIKFDNITLRQVKFNPWINN